MSITIQFLGAAGTVTGSQFLVRAGDRAVLVDCGMFQGSPEEIARNRMDFAFDPATVDAVLLTHAHLDHCGRLPQLVRHGYDGPIYATAATHDIAEIVLRDSAKLQEEAEARWRRHHPEEAAALEGAGGEEESAQEVDDEDLPRRLREAKPEARTTSRAAIYDEEDVDRTVALARGVRYEEEVDVADGIRAVFHDAGHILGSAIIELRVDGTTIVFSGDLGRPNTPILRDPTRLAHADYVLVESTYGNREHEPQDDAVQALADAINDTAHGRGVMLIPAFAVGRTQELVWVLDDLLREGRIPHLPLYIDSPMASRASQVYLRHPEDYDRETVELLRSGGSPLEYPGEQYTDSVDASKSIRRAPRPLMVMAASGMLTGGRIMHHLKDFLPDPVCTLLFIGYQGVGTLGRHLQSGGTSARIDGQEYPVRCRVRSISGFSAHADEHELDAWLAGFGSASGGNGRPRSVFVVHGDPDAAEAFAERIRGMGMRPHLPAHREVVTLA